MKPLKIVEQIIIVLVLAVLIPIITIGIIISNVSQQSVRSELANNASLMAHFVGDAIEEYIYYYNNKYIKEKLNWRSPVNYRIEYESKFI